MRKRVFAAVLAALLPLSTALAEVCEGRTVAASTLYVEAEASAVLEEVCVETGALVAEGDVLATLRPTRVFASQDGVVARLRAAAGDRVDGSVLEIAPVSQYTIYCTVDGAYASARSTLVHSGEALYIRCTADGSHRGTGIVAQIDGSEYQVLATGGEFYVGETVYLYRDADFTGSQRVGVGTVVTAGTETYESQGTLLRLCVEAGESVERGELLYEYIGGGDGQLRAPASGIVVEAPAQGGAVSPGSTAFAIAPLDQICVELQVDETLAARLRVGETLSLRYAGDAEEVLQSGTIASISAAPEGGLYTATILPEIVPERLGLTVFVHIPDLTAG